MPDAYERYVQISRLAANQKSPVRRRLLTATPATTTSTGQTTTPGGGTSPPPPVSSGVTPSSQSFQPSAEGMAKHDGPQGGSYPPAGGYEFSYDWPYGGPGFTGFLYKNRQTLGGYQIAITFLAWDTSSLPDNANITSAKLRLYIAQWIADEDRDLVAEYYTWPRPLTMANYTPSVGNNAITGAKLRSMPTNGQIEIPLTGLDGISKTATTYMRLGISGGAPSASTPVNSLRYNHSADHGGAPEPNPITIPVLTVYYG